LRVRVPGHERESDSVCAADRRPHAGDDDERAFEQLIRSPERGGVWILECDATPAGLIVLTVMYAMEYGGLRGFVDDFYVRPQFRKQGLGGQALATVKAHCLARGIRALFVQTGPDNAIAQRVYKRAGFSDTSHVLFVQPLASPIHRTS